MSYHRGMVGHVNINKNTSWGEFLNCIQSSPICGDVLRLKSGTKSLLELCEAYCSSRIETEWLAKFNAEHHKKSAERSLQLRLDGNKAFAKSNDKEAIVCYTNSILQAPPACDGCQLGLAFGNRSAVLARLGKQEACLVDIENALGVAGYPPGKRHKLYTRKMQCLLSLGRQEEGRAAKEEACEALRHVAEGADREDAAAKIENIWSESSFPTQSKMPKHDQHGESRAVPPPPFLGSNKMLEGASVALELRDSDDRGRYITARDAVAAGRRPLCGEAIRLSTAAGS
ncbi:PREDICTED: uncharacterized protein LOC106808690 [Priapulus caudatus]|uniref:Uncharacterized protein LOC106808690 n=1 Tax=Priapulus caudatus TaxID=37621 RepID=A0ABM1E482_PRICU|nr:PREDICTED: uncharacterized protein LOC106808690 [Priapulus caudatus]